MASEQVYSFISKIRSATLKNSPTPPTTSMVDTPSSSYRDLTVSRKGVIGSFSFRTSCCMIASRNMKLLAQVSSSSKRSSEPSSIFCEIVREKIGTLVHIESTDRIPIELDFISLLYGFRRPNAPTQHGVISGWYIIRLLYAMTKPYLPQQYSKPGLWIHWHLLLKMIRCPFRKGDSE